MTLIAACGDKRQKAATREPDYPTAVAVLDAYYRALQNRDFDAAAALIAPGEIRDRWNDYEDGYRRNLAKLRAFSVATPQSEPCRAYDRPALECTMTVVTLDVNWKRVITSRDGTVVRFVQIARLTPQSPLRIIGEGSGP